MSYYMYAAVNHRKNNAESMDKSDIEYILELLNDAISEQNWDKVDEARDTLKEFTDIEELPTDE